MGGPAPGSIMTDFRLLGRVHFCCFLAVSITFGWQQFAQAQVNDGAKSRIAPSISSAFAVGGSARKELPPLDPLYCLGPAVCAPCASHHSGFLYYGTLSDQEIPQSDPPATGSSVRLVSSESPPATPAENRFDEKEAGSKFLRPPAVPANASAADSSRRP